MKDAEHLINAYLDDELTPEQQEEFIKWLESDREHVRQFVREVHAHKTIRDLVVAQKDAEAFELPPMRQTMDSQLFNEEPGIRGGWGMFAAIAAVVVGTLYFFGPGLTFTQQQKSIAASDRLIIQSESLIQQPMTDIAAAYQSKGGMTVEKDFKVPELIIDERQVNKHGDVLISGDEKFMARAEQEGWIGPKERIAAVQMVFIVAKGNPKNLHTLADLKNKKLRIGMGNAASTVMGSAAKEKLGSSFNAISSRIQYQPDQISELPKAIASGQIDVALVWKPVAMEHAAEVDWVNFSENRDWVFPIYAAAVLSSKHADSANGFIRWLSSFRARQNFTKCGYETPLAGSVRGACMCQYVFKRNRPDQTF
jgi:molybdate transport system substrate-binding protein